jgi:hypothetical protein
MELDMETLQIIGELKALGLDPAQPDLEKLDDDRIQDLLKALELKKGDKLAADYILAMNNAINQLDTLGYVRPEV